MGTSIALNTYLPMPAHYIPPTISSPRLPLLGAMLSPSGTDRRTSSSLTPVLPQVLFSLLYLSKLLGVGIMMLPRSSPGLALWMRLVQVVTRARLPLPVPCCLAHQRKCHYYPLPHPSFPPAAIDGCLEDDPEIAL